MGQKAMDYTSGAANMGLNRMGMQMNSQVWAWLLAGLSSVVRWAQSTRAMQQSKVSPRHTTSAMPCSGPLVVPLLVALAGKFLVAVQRQKALWRPR